MQLLVVEQIVDVQLSCSVTYTTGVQGVSSNDDEQVAWSLAKKIRKCKKNIGNKYESYLNQE